MKIITNKGELQIPENFAFTIEQNSPAFSYDGTQSVPITLPGSEKNNIILNFPNRLARINKFDKSIDVSVNAGVFQKKGRLALSSSSKDGGIICAIYLNESDLYNKIQNVKLPEIFSKIVRTDYSGTTKIQSWITHLQKCMIEEISDDFTIFPVAVNYDKENGKFKMLNQPDHTSQLSYWPLIYKARRIYNDDEATNVPEGYGVTPFLWLWRVIELLFAEYDYTINNGSNPFKNNNILNKIVVINNTADTLCAGSIKYSDLVPDITIGDFIKWIKTKYNCDFFIHPESHTVDIISFDTILSSVADSDYSNIIDGAINTKFVDYKSLEIFSKTDLEEAKPAEPTWDAFCHKYDVLTPLNEYDYRSIAYKYSVIQRLSTGTFYKILRRPGDTSIKYERLGSNYFSYSQGDLEKEKIESIDLMPPMVEIKLGLVSYKEANVICPFIGDMRHISTAYKDEKISDQQLIVAFSAGMAQESTTIAAKYNLGTTQKYNNLGNSWISNDITTPSLYTMFFKEYNSILKNSGVEIEAKINYSISDFMNLKLNKLKMINNQKYIIKSLNYTIGTNSIKHNNTKLLLIKKHSPVIEDILKTIPSQLYTWEFASNLNSLLEEFEGQEWASVTWDYTDENPSRSNFEYIPPPTAEQYNSGLTFYNMSNGIKITAYRQGSTDPIYSTKILDSWFIPILLQ